MERKGFNFEFLIVVFTFSFSVLSYLCILPAAVTAEEMSGGDYKLKGGIFSIAGFIGGTSTYNLQDIVGVNGLGAMAGSNYALNSGFYNLNSLPQAVVGNYNDSRPTEDETPTLEWLYSDADGDIQKRYQLQVARGDFSSVVVDTGMVSSAVISYTTPILPRTGEREKYQWRVRVDDGFSWSGWATASSGFSISEGGFLISGLGALTTPGGAVIENSCWQRDNDPYFYWEAPPMGIEVLGYSYALDGLPDDEIDSWDTHYYFPQHAIGDGTHTFYVKAQRSSGVWGEAAPFNIWVDTTAPTVNQLAPGLGGVISNDQPEVRAVVSDTASGVAPETIELRINQALVEPAYDAQSGAIAYIPSIPFSDGEITISLKAYDVVGNYSLPLSWSFVVDTQGPSGSIRINNGDETTTSNTVTLDISAQDATTNIAQMIFSNDGVFDTETWEAYTSLRRNWILPAVNGMRKVYARVKDEAGNISEAFFDNINLLITAPQTYILSGPSGITPSQSAQFSFRGSLNDCQFSCKFDNQDWSDWSGDTTLSGTDFPEGNHYFTVRSAKDLNRDGLLQLDEVDSTPALRVWTVSFSSALKPPAKPEKPVKHWEEE